MAERGSKGCCHAPFYCSEFYSYCSFLAFLEKREKMKKANKINGFCTFLHVFLPSGRTSNPLLSAIKTPIKSVFMRLFGVFTFSVLLQSCEITTIKNDQKRSKKGLKKTQKKHTPTKKARRIRAQTADKVHNKPVGFVFFVEKGRKKWYNRGKKRVMK